MSKTVMIPSTQGNPWVCSVNNTKYSYEAGTEQTVPDEVAAIIDSADDFPPAAPDVDAPFNAGGGWPADLPKPSVGGYGYTEQDEQTIVDQESVNATEYILNTYYRGSFETRFDIVDDGFYSVIFNGTEYRLPTTYDSKSHSYVIGEATADRRYDFSRYPFVILSNPVHTFLYTESAGEYVVTVKAVTETVHKIDEKYLPEAGGGAMVVNFTAGAGGFTADKTPQEIVSAFGSGTFVYAVLMGAQTATLTAATDYGEGEFNVQFDAFAVVPETGLSITHLEWSSDDSEWNYSMGTIPLN